VAMALDIRADVERRCGPLPPRAERYRVGELIGWCQLNAPHVEAHAWQIALDHERRALAGASLDPGAAAALDGAHAAGWATALWTNNAREVSLDALARFDLLGRFDLIVTREEMRRMKPDPDGWHVIAAHFALAGATGSYMVGDSWVDGLAATKAGVSFVAYRARDHELERWNVTPVVRLDDLAALPAWLVARDGG